MEKMLKVVKVLLVMGDESSESMESDSASGDLSANSSDKPQLTDNQKRQLQNAVKKQKKFMDGEIAKKALSKKDKGVKGT